MSYVKERVSYLKGLAEGMQLSDTTNEGKMLNAIIEVLNDMALNLEDMKEVQEELMQQIDCIDEDLGEVEKMVFDEDEDCDCGCDCDCEDDDCVAEIECPHCKEKIVVREDMIDTEGDFISCPSCKKDIDVEWECSCGDCGDTDEE